MSLRLPRIDHGRHSLQRHLRLAVAWPGLYACSNSMGGGGTRDCPWGAACFVGLTDCRLKGKTVRERARILVVEDEMLFA